MTANLYKYDPFGRRIKKGLSPHGTVPEWYYHYDGLGSVTNLSDSSGAVIESYTYDVFGKPAIKDASGNTLQTSSVGNRFMFTGREYDEETGLYYYRSRYYSPTLGRFLQRDPVGYVAGINLYSYCSNNPVNWVDPFGWDKQGNKGNFPGGFMIPPKTTPEDPRPKDPSPPEPTKEPWWKPTPGRVLRWTGRILQETGQRVIGRGLGVVGIILEPGGMGKISGIIVGGAGGAALGAYMGTQIFPGPGIFVGGVIGGIGGGIFGGWTGGKFDSPYAENVY